VLASPIGEYLTFVKDGINGFICKSSREFKEKIIQINNMPRQEFDNLRRNTAFGLEDFSTRKFCVDLINEITKHNILFK
jgi:glycosyltransferase involved in cell wall biosynthesis